jgi:hypothetical protein
VSKRIKNVSTGKKNTRTYQVIVDPSTRINGLSAGGYGTTNDITMSHMDPISRLFLDGSYSHVEFVLFSEKGQPILVRGAFLITDNGFEKLACFVMPQKIVFKPANMRLSEWIESIRKDVERTFGILKARWRILRNAIPYHNVVFIDAVMTTCCVFHNIILRYDGLDLPNWENVDWEQIHLDDGEDRIILRSHVPPVDMADLEDPFQIVN